MGHNHDFREDKTFTQHYVETELKKKYPNIWWCSKRLICCECGKVKYQNLHQTTHYFGTSSR